MYYNVVFLFHVKNRFIVVAIQGGWHCATSPPQRSCQFSTQDLGRFVFVLNYRVIRVEFCQHVIISTNLMLICEVEQLLLPCRERRAQLQEECGWVLPN